MVFLPADVSSGRAEAVRRLGGRVEIVDGTFDQAVRRAAEMLLSPEVRPLWRTAVPLAAGEQFSSKWEFRQLIEEEHIPGDVTIQVLTL